MIVRNLFLDNSLLTVKMSSKHTVVKTVVRSLPRYVTFLGIIISHVEELHF